MSDLFTDTASYWSAKCAELEQELARLRAALLPFAAVARGIPDNWPGECRLFEDFDMRNRHHVYLGYHSSDEPGCLPTIAEWRAAEAADAAKETT